MIKPKRKSKRIIANLLAPDHTYLQSIELHTSKQQKITEQILKQLKNDSKEKNFPKSCLTCIVVAECTNSFKYCPFDSVFAPPHPLQNPKRLKWLNPDILTPKGSLER